jgi:hypothetical protein
VEQRAQLGHKHARPTLVLRQPRERREALADQPVPHGTRDAVLHRLVPADGLEERV